MTRPSRAAAKRAAAAARTAKQAPPQLPAELVAHLDSYVPEKVAPSTWTTVRTAHRDVMMRSGLKGEESFKKRSRELAHYLADRHEQGLSIAVADAMTYAAIDDHYARRCEHLTEGSRNERRSRLRKLAEAVNPGLDAPARAVTLGHQSIKPPYSADEEAAIKRLALRQRNKGSRRAMCAAVGLCAGAGCDSVDLRDMHGRHVHDFGPAGILINIPGKRPRSVVVRREYEELVRIGMEGIGPDDLVIGKVPTRRGIVSKVVESAEILGDVPHIEAARLRATWLAWLMCRAVPLNILLDAAGLISARTLIDLLPHLPSTDPALDVLRGEEDPS
jgi:hypothetical protein